MSQNNSMTTAVVLSDLQIPFQDQPVVDLVLSFIQELKPKTVVLNGDVTDAYDLSSHDRVRFPNAGLWKQEVKQARDLMHSLRDVPERVWIGGNHEYRLDRYIAKHAGALAEEPGVEFANRIGTRDFGFKFIPYAGDEPGKYMLGKLTVTHGFLVRQHSAFSAKAHFERLGTSVLIGHTHRLGSYYKTNQNGVHGAWENGCLCKLNPEYALFPDWQLGFAVVHVAKSGHFQVQQVPIFNGGFYYGSQRYEVPRRRGRKR